MKANIFRTLLSALLLIISFGANAKVYLVSVGVGDYSSYPAKLNNLSLTVNDARTMAEIYSANTSVDYALLINEKATKARIIKAIGKLFNKAGINDIVVFFFSGHGYPGGLCAYDGNITYKAIREAMAKSKSKNKMMFIDSCNSGSMRVGDNQSQGAVTAAKKANVMLFLSSRNTENSLENPRMSNGHFTTYLSKGLTGSADADRNRTITAKELFNYVHSGVVEISHDMQHPVMWGQFDDKMPVMKW